ncbi:apoptosis regulatory protein Siva [Leptidea sinapis]|uniref:Apoptosis regulatory protein Siva n=1 Tax=Leptidea sinapis TaxID=189913 RepID=A0A5E4QLL1_9NEOP|nr:apoptosis regulatory protein Siva [Leptidea sinapis]VVC98193.1 unnamed protein product [Leptidea sinapis]
MAKRANPYVDDFIPQSKTHIGLKQFNNNNKETLQQVYEKTLSILFNGAKNSSTNIRIPEIQSDKKDNYKQLFISPEGMLQHCGQLKTENNKHECKCGGREEDVCAYCETPLCCSCGHNCSSCHQLYCSSCSIIVSEGTEVCVSCYR